MKEFFEIIQNFGFPVALSAYLLLRFEGKIDLLTKAISGKDGLIDKIETLTEKLSEKK